MYFESPYHAINPYDDASVELLTSSPGAKNHQQQHSATAAAESSLPSRDCSEKVPTLLSRLILFFMATACVFKFHVEIYFKKFLNRLYSLHDPLLLLLLQVTRNNFKLSPSDSAKKGFVNHSIFSDPNPLLCLPKKLCCWIFCEFGR